MTYLDEKRVELIYEMPLAEVLFDFYDKLKSYSRGYASFDYEMKGYEQSELVKLDILINKEEVDALMVLLVDTIVKETPTLMKNNIVLQTIGDLSRLPQATRDKFLECIEQTSQNTGLTLIIALSYSARWELIQAAKHIAQAVQNGQLLPEDINEEVLSNHLTTAQYPDPDLLIRTSGELRISNFLLWQLAYSEMYFTPCLWPEFTNEEFYRAIVDYQHRERRFGKTSEQIR